MRCFDLFGNDVWCKSLLEHVEKMRFEGSLGMEEIWRDIKAERHNDLCWSENSKYPSSTLTFSLGTTSPVEVDIRGVTRYSNFHSTFPRSSDPYTAKTPASRICSVAPPLER